MKSARTKGFSYVIDIEEDFTQRNMTNSDGFVILDKEEELRKCRRMIKQLEQIARDQREKRMDLQQKMSLLMTRSVLKERQFKIVLAKSVDALSIVDKSDEQAMNAQITRIYGEIFRKFDDMNSATNSFINTRYSENLKAMQTRISNILSFAEDELSKNKKIRTVDRSGLQKSIEQILEIARKIDDENSKLRKKIESQSFKCRVLNNEKELLIEEVVQKKQLISKLYMGNKKMREQILLQNESSTIKGQSITQKTNQTKSITLSSRPIPKAPQSQIHSSRPHLKLAQQNGQQNAISLLHRSSKRYTLQNRINNQTNRLLSRSVNVAAISQTDKLRNSTIQNKEEIEKTVQHLKASLERERRKNQELGRLFKRLYDQNQEVNSAIANVIAQYKKENQDARALEILVKSEKLLEIIRNLKQRLSMVERPAFNCGWGETTEEQEILGESEGLRSKAIQ